MLRLLKIEWLKLKDYKTFTVLSAIYYISLLLIMCSVQLILSWMSSKGMEFQGITPEIIPFYDFPDVWQNLTYLACYVKYLLGFIVIISITNEFSYRTVRQNIIDGMSASNFLISKELMILAFSLLNVIIIWISGTAMGLIYGTSFQWSNYFGGMDFLFAHFLELLTFLNLAFLLGLLMKKSGFAIIILCLYTFPIEPMITGILGWLTNDHWLISLFPMKAINELVPWPYFRYILLEVQDHVSITSVGIAIGWLAIYLSFAYYKLVKKDIA